MSIELGNVLAKLSREEFQAIMNRYGPQWSNMYLHPKTDEQDKQNSAECKAGMKRVREHLKFLSEFGVDGNAIDKPMPMRNQEYIPTSEAEPDEPSKEEE